MQLKFAELQLIRSPSDTVKMADDQIEHTLFISREVSVFKIPSRVGAGGHKSAEWLVADKIFTGRLRAIAKGESCEIRMEDTNR